MVGLTSAFCMGKPGGLVSFVAKIIQLEAAQRDTKKVTASGIIKFETWTGRLTSSILSLF